MVVSKQTHDTGEFGSLDLTGKTFFLPGINFPCICLFLAPGMLFKVTISATSS